VKMVSPAVFFDVLLTGRRVRYCRYTWKLYSERLMTLTGVYGFWKYVSNLERRETRRYLEMLYALKYRTMASTVPLAVEGEPSSK
jgi:sucrose synthase